MKNANKIMMVLFAPVLLLTALHNVNIKKEYKPGDYVPEEDAFFVKKIEDETGLIKAQKFITPTDNKYSTQKNYSHGINMLGDLENTWDAYTGKGTTVAVIDDGFDYNHPEYTRADGTSAILDTSRYYYASGNSAYYKSYSSDPTCIKEDWDSDNDEWATHGTNTSTTAAAPMNNGGGVGIAPEADILALKIDFSFVAIEAAINYAVSQHVDVINMSLGAYSETFVDGWGDEQEWSSDVSTYLDEACQNAYDAGIIVIAAAGNESTWHKSYPACNAHVIGVGALEKNDEDTLAAFTNYVGSSQTGEINVDILAPGYVYTAHQEGTKSSVQHTYNKTQGTSFSSPIVAASACLWKQKYPNGTPDQFLNQLQSSASDIGAYKNKDIPVSLWGNYSDVGPSNITCGRLNVSNLLEINEPYVTVEQDSINIVTGQSKQIQLDTYNGSISYSVLDTNVATVNDSGLVTGVNAGTTTLTITATKNAKTATANVTINVGTPIYATSISIDPTSKSLEVGQTYDIFPTISTVPENATKVFLFESEDESVATVDLESGLLTATGVGTTTINIYPLDGEGEAHLALTVTEATTPTSWNKITSTSDLTTGDYLIVYGAGNVAFNGGLTTLDATSNTIPVTISNSTIAYSSATAAAKFTIDSYSGGYSIKAANGSYIGRNSGSNGLDTDSSPIKNTITFSSGDATITGTGGKTLLFNTASDQNRFRYMSNGGAIQLYKANSGGGSSTTVPVTSVSLSDSSATLTVGQNKTLTATVLPNNATNKNVTWSSSNTSVATVNNGVVTAVSAGTATITVTTQDGNKTATCSVTVNNPTVAVTSVSLSSNNLTLSVGDTSTLIATVLPNNATNKSVSWSSSNTSVATVSSGTITALAVGNTTITVTTQDGNKTATCAVTVVAAGSLVPGDSVTVTYTSTSSNAASVSSGTAPTGSTITFNNTYGNSEQMTSSNSETWTLTGYSGYFITGIQAHLKRNSTKGTGNLTLTNNGSSVTTEISSISRDTLTSSYQYYDLINSSFICNGNLVLRIAATENSLYCDSIKVTYAEVAADDKIVRSLSATYSGDSVFIGGSLDESKVSVTISYTDSTKYPNETLSATHYSLSEFSSASARTSVVTVTYTGSLKTENDAIITTTFNVTIIVDEISSITASCSKSYHPGELINKSDITVTAHYMSGKSETVSDFTFANDGYQFTYEDAPSGGSSANKQFSVSHAGKSATFNVPVNRVNHVTPSTSSVQLTGTAAKAAGITGTKASEIANYNNLVINGVTCTATNVYVYAVSSVDYISFGQGEGEIYNDASHPLSASITSLSITLRSGARTDGVLSISTDGTNWETYSAAKVSSGDYRYFKVAYTSTSSSYSNFSSINITLKGTENPVNVANYIMYEDTNGQCVSKLGTVINMLNTMSSADKTTFFSSSDYVIATARARLEAWALHEGKIVTLNDNQVIANRNVSNIITADGGLTIIAIISLTSFAAFSLYFFVQKKKKQ